MESYKSTEKNQSNLRLEDHHFTHLVFNFISSIKGGQELFLSDEKLEVKVVVETSTNKIIVEFSFNTTAKEGDEKIFNLSAGYKGIFVYTPLTESQLITSFAKINAPAIIYPLLRASIASITLAVGVPPLALPVINFTKFPVAIEETSI
jgi:preprotein translocase subunit SecB